MQPISILGVDTGRLGRIEQFAKQVGIGFTIDANGNGGLNGMGCKGNWKLENGDLIINITERKGMAQMMTEGFIAGKIKGFLGGVK